MQESANQILVLASQIVTAHLSHNSVQAGTVPDLIRRVYNTLANLGHEGSRPHHAQMGVMDAGYAPSADHSVQVYHHHIDREKASPESQVHPEHGQTVFNDQLLCLECGVRMKMLKRHLQTVHKLTPREYRAKWGLGTDYPMVAAEYAKLRSSLARESGLGLKPGARAERIGRGSRLA